MRMKLHNDNAVFTVSRQADHAIILLSASAVRVHEAVARRPVVWGGSSAPLAGGVI